jgi:hypothetical protein
MGNGLLSYTSMRKAKLKDIILKALIENKALASLNIPEYTIYTLLKEMESEGYIETINTTTKTTGQSATCKVRRVYPQANHLYNTSSFVKKERSKTIQEIPKRYWYLVALFSYIIGLLTPIITERLRSQFLPPTKIESTVKISQDEQVSKH